VDFTIIILLAKGKRFLKIAGVILSESRKMKFLEKDENTHWSSCLALTTMLE